MNGEFLYVPTGERLVLSGIAFSAACFYPGTMIATPNGERAVETLVMEDLILTTEGAARPIRWMGRQTVSTRFGDPLRILPVRITAGALADGIPARDLMLSPDHAVLVEGVLIQAGALVNGTTILRVFDVPEIFTYHHIELAEHDLVLAEGAPAETFVDNVDRLAFDNWDEHEALYGNLPSIPEMDRPRAKAQRQVPRFVRAALASRAVIRRAG
ncbi:Hint domain-containing protein [Plastoroseomonas arctica]|uniref:Hint domain-containing protein n=1 Tax=Plastoroseomonas arctica TaxID=1509237 RepID=UPI001FE58162|nr:Hint domain-containing protein [Plastoroseomonas arctica]